MYGKPKLIYEELAPYRGDLRKEIPPSGNGSSLAVQEKVIYSEKRSCLNRRNINQSITIQATPINTRVQKQSSVSDRSGIRIINIPERYRGDI